MWTFIWCSLFIPFLVTGKILEDVMKERNKIYQSELDLTLGSDLILNENEQLANNVIMELKEKMLNDSFYDPPKYFFYKHFFDYRNDVKDTELYKIVRKMPKGAVLHAHDTGLISPDFLMSLTYSDNLYICTEQNEMKFKFSKDTPKCKCNLKCTSKSKCNSQWQLLSDVRKYSKNLTDLNGRIREQFTIVVSDPIKAYPDINVVWNKFQRYFITTGGFLTYKPVWEKYFYETLRVFRDDNIMYIEIRSVLPELYDLEGNIYDSVATAQTYNNVLEYFKKDYPDFFGAKLIYAPLRYVTEKTVEQYIGIAKQLKEKMPDFFAGFDLVGQEDLGYPIKDFLPTLVKAADDIDLFFHAGETNWYGTTSDENLIDAVTLGVKRIGHGYALLKHPLVMEEVKKKQIALEVNVVSNMVLKLIDDVRTHPLAVFLAQGLPVVLSSDDPGVWEADPLSHDFFLSFVGVASRHADIKLLKKLALNSLYYSTAPFKDDLINDFEKRWSIFINGVLKDYVKKQSTHDVSEL